MNNVNQISDVGKNSSKMWYLICLVLPFSTYDIANVIRPYEVIALAALVGLVISGKQNFHRITLLDKLVFAYAFYQLISVLVGSSVFYESARAYRYIVLGPVLVYVVIRLLPFSIHTAIRAHFVMAAAVTLQSVYVLYLYIETGERPAGLIHDLVGFSVPYALIVSYVFVFFLFSRKVIKTKLVRLVALTALLIVGAGLITSASRGVLVPAVLMLFSSSWLLKRVSMRKLLSGFASGSLVVLLLVIAVAPPKYVADESELIENKRSLERIISIEGYMVDISDRVQFWSIIFNTAMEKPIFGYGASAYSFGSAVTIQKRGGPHHSHNMLMASLLAGGIPGLVLMMNLFFTVFYMVTRFTGENEESSILEKSLLVWVMVYFVVGLTNSVLGVLLFFMLALVQEIVLYNEKSRGSVTNKPLDKLEDSDMKLEENSRILSRARAGTLLAVHKSHKNSQ